MADPDMTGAVPVAEWPKEIDEVVEIFVVHWQLQYAVGEDRNRWRCWLRGSWTDFNSGGWIWHGMAGTVTHVRPIVEDAHG